MDLHLEQSVKTADFFVPETSRTSARVCATKYQDMSVLIFTAMKPKISHKVLT
jgi:hypothetical protein